MRFATAFLLAAVPTCAAAQPPAPPKPAEHKPAEHKPAHAKPAAHKPRDHASPPGHKPVVHKPATHKPPPAKPAPPKPTAAPPPPSAEPAADPQKGSNTGLPLPRFAALKTDEVNFRRGPGTRYPIEWVYKRRDLPVQIEREFEVWRLIADPDGSKGWVQAATLTGRRTAIVVGADRTLRQAASDTAGPVAKLEKGVIVRLRVCEAKSDWCQVQVGDYRGYIKRNDVWGIMPAEVIP